MKWVQKYGPKTWGEPYSCPFNDSNEKIGNCADKMVRTNLKENLGCYLNLNEQKPTF